MKQWKGFGKGRRPLRRESNHGWGIIRSSVWSQKLSVKAKEDEMWSGIK